MSATLVLADTREAMVTAWRRFCSHLDFVTIHHGSILEIECDALLSPVNSFGFMDSGIDQLYRQHFGAALEQRLQEKINEQFSGELLVGQALLLETGDDRVPYLIAAPTMRVPMPLRDSVNPYLAARAAFLLLRDGQLELSDGDRRPVSEVVQTLALPGLGTGVGQLSPEASAHQLRVAIDEVLLGDRNPPRSLAEASRRHQRLNRSRPEHGTLPPGPDAPPEPTPRD